MKLYLFKRAADDKWVFGQNIDCLHEPGICKPIPSTNRETITIIYFQRNNANPDIFNQPVTDFLKENGDAYADFADLSDAYADFFFSVSGGVVTSNGLMFPDQLTGLRGRAIFKEGQWFFDKELTSTGFDGVESTDGGATGDWMTSGGF